MDIAFLMERSLWEDWTIYKVIRCCLKLSVRVSKKLINVQEKVAIWKCLSYIARYFVSTLKSWHFFIRQQVSEQRHSIQFRFRSIRARNFHTWDGRITFKYLFQKAQFNWWLDCKVNAFNYKWSFFVIQTLL